MGFLLQAQARSQEKINSPSSEITQPFCSAQALSELDAKPQWEE